MPFDKTVFNKTQLPYLLLDVERLIVTAADAEDKVSCARFAPSG
jgi:hypothetical protein